MLITFGVSMLPKEAFEHNRPEMPINYWLLKSVNVSMMDYLELRSEEFLLINVLEEFKKCEVPLVCRNKLLQRLRSIHNFSEAITSKRIVNGCASLLHKSMKAGFKEPESHKSLNKSANFGKTLGKKSTKLSRKLSAKNPKVSQLNEDNTLVKIKKYNDTPSKVDIANFENVQVLPKRCGKRSRASTAKSLPSTPTVKKITRKSKTVSKCSPEKTGETISMQLRARTVYYR